MAGLTRRDGMQYNYQLNSFHPPIFTPLLSNFFADEYAYVYAVKPIALQTYLLLGSKERFFPAFFCKKIEKMMCFLLQNWKRGLRWSLIKHFSEQSTENIKMKNLLFVSFIFCPQIPLSGAISKKSVYLVVNDDGNN